MTTQIKLLCIDTQDTCDNYRSMPNAPSCLLQRGDTDILNSTGVRVIFKNSIERARIQMLRIQTKSSWIPWTGQLPPGIFLKLLDSYVDCSLSLVIIYKNQYQTFWTKPEMCNRKTPYLMEEPIKKVSV